MHVDVAKYHTCHAKWRSMSPSATPATQTVAATTAPNPTQAPQEPDQHTQSEARCHQVPRLPRQRRRRPSAKPNPSAPPEPAQHDKFHACHAECTSMSPSTTPATQSGDRCRQVPCLPRKRRRRPRCQTQHKRATGASPVR